MNARTVDWRTYGSTLALALHMQREVLELTEAAHTGDADVLLERAAELRRQLRALTDDFGLNLERDGIEELLPDREAQLWAVRELCRALGISLPDELREPPC